MIVRADHVIGMDGHAIEAAGAELLLQILGERRHLAATLDGGNGDGVLVNLPRPGVPAVRRGLGLGGGGGDEAEGSGGEQGKAHEGTPEKARGEWGDFGAGQAVAVPGCSTIASLTE